MKSPFKPLADRIVGIQKDEASKTASGIYIPETAKEKPMLANVVAVGKDIKEVKVGDEIVYSQYKADNIKVNGQEYLFVKEEDVLAVIK